MTHPKEQKTQDGVSHQPVHEPVAWMNPDDLNADTAFRWIEIGAFKTPVYTTPQPQPAQEPVAWIEHEWSGTGLRHLHFEKREPMVRDEVVNPVWTPLYTAPPQRQPLPDEYVQQLLAEASVLDAADNMTPEQCFEWLVRRVEREHDITGEHP